ncbi:extracellular solute-binding protein [Cohnella zeiphila]|uniref:Extracellular solute-binding protein n=1 Tax=Cohnella zeiphila TaxID=2761120 RepID=A0A7X0SJP7_9BACL|nr:extracellular solute-binding protein [Cohnella zeiphila]MBB6731202.1 extracellular solute-binding protein [Cohnella zeiphila]
MKMSKRNVMLAGASVALIGMLAACSHSDHAENSGPSGDSGSGKKPTISATIYDRGLIAASEGTMENNRWTKWINENGPTNVKFTAVPRTESKQKLNTLFASGSAPDLIFEFDPNIKNPLYEQKQLMPLDDMINQYSTTYKKVLDENPILKQVATKSDGKMYEFGKINEAIPQNIAVIRQDWLDKLKLTAPKTTEELYQVAKAFAEQDPDGNGQKDTYGLNVGPGLLDIFGGGGSYNIENGQLVRTWDGYKFYIDFLKRLYDEGVIDKDYITDNNGAKARQDFLNGKTGIYFVQASSYSLWNRLWVTDYATLKTNAPGADLEMMPYPKSPNGQFINWINNPVQLTAVVNRNAKDPKAVMEYIDFLSKPETGRTLTNGLEGVHWQEGQSGCPNTIDQEKNKTELGYVGQDYDMIFSVTSGGKCSFIASSFNPDKPDEKLAKDKFKESMNIFYSMIDQGAKWPGLTHSEHMPTVPQDLLVDSQNGSTEIGNLVTKAIVGGASYTPDKAISEIQALWTKYNGAKIDAFYQEWYTANKDTALMPEDIFQIVKEQKATQDEILK